MKIYNTYHQPYFQGKNTITRVADKSVGKCIHSAKISDFDKFVFKQYMFAKNLRVNWNQAEVDKLFKLDGEEFISCSTDYLMKIMNIPAKLKPEIKPAKLSVGDMGYIPYEHILLVNTDSKLESKANIFALIRHELQHMVQSFDILRYEGLADKIVSVYLKNGFNYEEDSFLIDTIVDNEEKLNIDHLKQTLNDDILIDGILELRKHKKNNDIEKYNLTKEKLIEYDRQETLNTILEVRDQVIEAFGSIKVGTKEGDRVQKLYDSLINDNYFNSDSSIDKGKYVYNVLEFEAINAQQILFDELNGKCFIKSVKDNAHKTRQNIQLAQNANSTLTEQEINTYKEIDKAGSQYNYKGGLKKLAEYLMD